MRGLRNLQFMFRGYFNFTKRDKPLPPLQGSLNGKTFVITGANSGIGYAAANEAAQKGARVFLLCRDRKRGEKAVDQLKQKTKNPNISLVICELGSPQSMGRAVKQLKQQVKQIDILVHNGGCMLNQRQFTKEGVEKNFATNTFAVYYLSILTLPLMTAESRTIVVSSGGCLTQELITEDIYMTEEDFDGTVQYARNKRQQLCLVEEMAKLYPKAGKFVTMHPGWSDTPGVSEAMPDFYAKMKDKLKTAEEGADTILYLSLAPFQKLVSGQFYYDREVADKHLTISFTSYKQKHADRLMERLRQLSKLE